MHVHVWILPLPPLRLIIISFFCCPVHSIWDKRSPCKITQQFIALATIKYDWNNYNFFYLCVWICNRWYWLKAYVVSLLICIIQFTTTSSPSAWYAKMYPEKKKKKKYTIKENVNTIKCIPYKYIFPFQFWYFLHQLYSLWINKTVDNVIQRLQND